MKYNLLSNNPAGFCFGLCFGSSAVCIIICDRAKCHKAGRKNQNFVSDCSRKVLKFFAVNRYLVVIQPSSMKGPDEKDQC